MLLHGLFLFFWTFDHILITYTRISGHPDFCLSVVKRHVIYGSNKFLIADPSVPVIHRFSLTPMAQNAFRNLGIHSRSASIAPPCVAQIVEMGERTLEVWIPGPYSAASRTPWATDS